MDKEPLYDAWAAYSDSKLANVIFAKELDRRFCAAKACASAVSLHPGQRSFHTCIMLNTSISYLLFLLLFLYCVYYSYYY